MIEQPPKFPDNPNHANGTCEDCGAPCQVYGCRWCPACYDAGSARIRDSGRLSLVQTAAEWAASFKPLSAPIDTQAPPAPWQREALAAVVRPALERLAGLPLVVDDNVPAASVLVWSARTGRTPEQVRAVCLLLDDVDADEAPPCQP